MCMTVTTGLKSQTGSGSPTALAGERNMVQTVVEFVASQPGIGGYPLYRCLRCSTAPWGGRISAVRLLEVGF